MQTELTDIFLVPVEEGFLLHAPLHGVTSLVNATMAQELQAFVARGSVAELSPVARPLAEALLARPASAPPLRRGLFSPPFISLLPTNECNMRCLYCAPSAGTGDLSSMSPEICEAALRYQAMVVRRDGFRELVVYYFGGEPFFAWDLVQFADAKGRELAKELGVSYRSECATNGYMPEEHAVWVAQHLSFAVVSLDGPMELHDRHRPAASGCGTYEAISRTLRVFEDEGLPYAIRCNVDSENVERLPEIIETFCHKFHPAKINIEPLVVYGRCLITELRHPEPSTFVKAVVAAGRVARQHKVELKLTTAQPERLAQSNCAMVEDSFIVAPDGLISACYMANHRGSEYAGEYAFGEIDAGSHTVQINQAKLDQVRVYGVANIPRCQHCFAKWHCSGGCRLFQTPPNCCIPPPPICLVTQKLTLWRILELLREFDKADRIRLDPQEVPA